jgi:hypothetical protein
VLAICGACCAAFYRSQQIKSASQALNTLAIDPIAIGLTPQLVHQPSRPIRWVLACDQLQVNFQSLVFDRLASVVVAARRQTQQVARLANRIAVSFN